MLGLLKYPVDVSKAQGLNQLWYKDTASTEAITNRQGTFSFRIPMKHIFGFCVDYDKIVYGLKHGLTLVKNTNDNAIFSGVAAGAEKVNLHKISWFMLYVIPADAEKFSIYKTIESNVQVPVAYRPRQCDMLSVPESTSFTWPLSVKTAPEKPRFIIVALQTAKDGDQTKNPSTFNHVNLKKNVCDAKLRSISCS